MNILISYCLFFNTMYSNKLKKDYYSAIESSKIFEDKYNISHIIYYDETVPSLFLKHLNSFKNVKTIKMNNSYNFEGCFWRFKSYNIFKNGYDIFISRDIDLPFEQNDLFILHNFIKSPYKLYFSFAKHRNLKYPNMGFILAGFFGMKKDLDFDFDKEINNFSKINSLSDYGKDEEFIAQTLYTKYKSIIFYEPNIEKIQYNKFYLKKIGLQKDHEYYIRLPENFKKFK